MDNFTRAYNYIDRIIFNNHSSKRSNAAADIDRMLNQIIGNYSSCDYEQAVIGFGFLDNGLFHISLDQKFICHNNKACNTWAQRLARQFYLSESSIAVTAATKASASLRPLAVGHESIAVRWVRHHGRVYLS
jgi:hypothetical protein